MKLYSGIDLNSTNSYLAIIDESGKRIFKDKLPNEIATITERLSLYSGTLEGVVVESRNIAASNMPTTSMMPSGWPRC